MRRAEGVVHRPTASLLPDSAHARAEAGPPLGVVVLGEILISARAEVHDLDLVPALASTRFFAGLPGGACLGLLIPGNRSPRYVTLPSLFLTIFAMPQDGPMLRPGQGAKKPQPWEPGLGGLAC